MIEIEIKVWGEAKEHVLEIQVDNYQPYWPGNGPSFASAGGDPPEGPEFDVLSVTMVRGKRRRTLSRKAGEKVVEENSDKIVEAIEALDMGY